MLFGDYYQGPFRSDLFRVIAGLAPIHDHFDGTTLQPRIISRENAVVRSWSPERQYLFAAGLFLTVLADQVCYTHFQPQYEGFRRLTLYPKWRGDCPGACNYQIHPRHVFLTIGRRPSEHPSWEQLRYSLFPDDLLSTMESEVMSFVRSYIPDVSPEAFWQLCGAEIPPLFRILYVGSRRARDADLFGDPA